VLRLAGIYGPGRTRLIDSVRDGTARRTAEIEQTNRIHREDCVGAIEHLLTHPRPESIYLGVDHEPVSKNAVLEYLAARLGVPPPAVEPSPPARARHGRGHKRCDGAKLRASGYRFIYPTFREGYDALLAT
jgi:nucleoside-diphosphate-sugar epimerase